MTYMPSPTELFEGLRRAYFLYYNTPFRLRNEVLNRERQERLDVAGGVWQEPLVEIRPRYSTTSRTLMETTRYVGAVPELAEFASLGMLKGIPSLYLHQEEALREAVRGVDIAATPGTGSGKTELLFLPILEALLRESATWSPGSAQQQRWWDSAGNPFVPQRTDEVGRPAAVRAIVLYPMNALADDQLVRLRKALDSDAIHAWLDANRHGHRFYFGRYTGSTPVLGRRRNQQAEDQLRTEMQRFEHNYNAARAQSEKKSFFLPRPQGAEMISRWDMLETPPDILITNYSMLHVMLMRAQEQPIFEQTRDWLRSNPDQRLALVVDESHLYRGTAGTEVAYMFRLLADRLGLSNDLDRFHILTASASLEPVRDDQFLLDFFGKTKNFAIITGSHPPVPEVEVPLTEHLAELLKPVTEDTEPDSAFGEVDGDRALLSAFHQGNPEPAKALSLSELAERLFPGEVGAEDATRNLLTLAARRTPAGSNDVRLRAHLFFRNVAGVWACVDSDCSELAADGRYLDSDRTVGRLYVEPRTRCDCGARVLELHYCQDCGDVYLGGFTTDNPIESQGRPHSLLADLSDLARLPDQANLERLATNYIIYWPRTDVPESERNWGTPRLTFDYVPANLNKFSGDVEAVNSGHHLGATGWIFQTQPTRRGNGEFHVDPGTLPAFPTQCASCGADWEMRYARHGAVAASDPKRYRSPIRGLRTGFEKINQVLTGELANALRPDERKLIVFSDSRQDAAKLASGIGLRHYQDLVRALAVEQIRSTAPISSDTIAAARDFYVSGQRSDENMAAVQSLRRFGLDARTLIEIWEDGGDLPQELSYIELLTSLPQLTQIEAQVGRALLDLGVNPGGTYPSKQASGYRQDRIEWTSLFDWNTSPVRPRGNLSVGQQQLQSEVNAGLREEFLNALIGGAGRDIESLGIGWLCDINDRHDDDERGSVGVARASLRVLALRRRFVGLREGSPRPPQFLRKFWESIVGPGNDTSALQTMCERIWGATVAEYCIKPDRLVIRPGSMEWVCPRCARMHLNPGAGICTRCSADLPVEGKRSSSVPDDYYAWKATTGNGRFRLQTAELTGQTDSADAEDRQMRFQGVFLDPDAVPIADELDLLSVTTTLEAGVDIGDLNAVELANMPPTRFNYQQRVGRAGRRETQMAYALTVCRGRSHDEYYFDRPESIANDPTPKPYLALDRDEIYLRSLTSEILRRAFRHTGVTDSSPTLNPHGDFGNCADWPMHRTAIETWLLSNRAELEAMAAGLANRASVGVPEMQHFIATVLSRVDETAASSNGPEDLSQRLAYMGHLPMFGFPTRVRYLYLDSPPRRSYPWPPAHTIDRDLSLAISTFAPGAETVRDGSVYRSMAIAGFRPTTPGRPPVSETDPLGPSQPVDHCHRCGSVVDADPQVMRDPLATCPRCGADHKKYIRVDIREPLGFASSRGEDFDGSFAWSGRGGSVRAVADPLVFPQAVVDDLEARAGAAKRLVLNDNNSRLFQFRRGLNNSRWPDAFYLAESVDWPDGPPQGSLDPNLVEVALGATHHTDIAFIGGLSQGDPISGLRANLTVAYQPNGIQDPWQGRRAAWYSLAFLLRTAAAAHLDVQPQEFSAEVHIGIRGSTQAVWTFLADTLENGAGFSTHLCSPSEFPSFIRSVENLITEYEQGDHAAECNSSCYRCIRDYTNMQYHALLDWRLARDLLQVSRTNELTLPNSFGERELKAWSNAYGGSTLHSSSDGSYITIERGGRKAIVIARHPLEAFEDGAGAIVTPRLAFVAAEASSATAVDATVIIDTVTLDRTPRVAAALVDEALANAGGNTW